MWDLASRVRGGAAAGNDRVVEVVRRPDGTRGSTRQGRRHVPRARSCRPRPASARRLRPAVAAGGFGAAGRCCSGAGTRSAPGEAAAGFQISVQSRHSRRTVGTHRSAPIVRRTHSRAAPGGEIPTTSMPAAANTASKAVVNSASKAVVNFASRSRIRNRNLSTRSSRSISRLRACWATHAPVGWAVLRCAGWPPRWMRWERERWTCPSASAPCGPRSTGASACSTTPNGRC